MSDSTAAGIRMLILDGEQADLVRVSAAMTAAALDARKRRVQEDEIVTASLRMSGIKLDHLLRELDAPPLRVWKEVPDDDRATFRRLAADLDRDPDGPNAGAVWAAIRAIVLRRADDRPTIQGEIPGILGGL